jgi:TRAP-type mannitol/chloroaromatic compound transport system substrate-binding protein
MGGWFRKEVKTVADLQGLKFRIAGLAGQMLQKVGVVPQQIAGGDVYPALEKGTIDAAEWVGPYDDQKLGFNKVAPFYYYPGWWEGGPQLDFFINQKAFDALSAENKAMVESAAAHAHIVMQARYDALNPGALKQLVGAGSKLRPFPVDVMNASFKAAMGVYDELNQSNPAWAKVYADYSKFRADQNLWFRFTEATFDRFMQAQKL